MVYRILCVNRCFVLGPLFIFIPFRCEQTQSTIFCVRCGTPRGIITHWLRSETHRDMAAWARSLVQGTHNAINYQREFSFRCVFQVRRINLPLVRMARIYQTFVRYNFAFILQIESTMSIDRSFGPWIFIIRGWPWTIGENRVVISI